jgi:hypothetical protein
MRIIHIIPAAFNYFDDIKRSAFGIVEKLSDYGIESQMITLQYNTVTKREKRETTGFSGPALSYQYKGSQSISQAFSTLSEYDIIHFHCPFLGAGKKIIDWQKEHTEIPFIVTYYREVGLVDFLSIFVNLYNLYYLPKIFQLAKVITCFSEAKFGFKSVNRRKVVDLSVKKTREFVGEDGKLLTENVYRVELEKGKSSLVSVDRLVEIYNLIIVSK